MLNLGADLSCEFVMFCNVLMEIYGIEGIETVHGYLLLTLHMLMYVSC